MTNPDDHRPTNQDIPVSLESISAVTLRVRDLGHSLAFYRTLGFELLYGDADAPLVSFRVGEGFLNLQPAGAEVVPADWGRVILYVDDVDAMHAHVCRLGYRPEFPPRDASWGERYFHLRDPDGHELSFAMPL